MSLANPETPRTRIARTAVHVITATSVTLLVAGQLAVLLFLGEWAIAGVLGLPSVALIVLLAISGVATAAIAVIIFVRVLRVEARLAQNKPADAIGWSLLMNSQPADRPPAGSV
jgi:hypothetical protein